jgi:hypothetical protein
VKPGTGAQQEAINPPITQGAYQWKTIRPNIVPGDTMWAIDIFHGSDYEEQVDHLLKLLNHDEGIEYLYSRYGKPDPVPGTFGNSNFIPP